MKRVLLLAALIGLSACETTAPDDKTGCVEFNHPTVHNGRQVVCRMAWCEQNTWSSSGDFHNTGGVATLWCDPVDE